MRRPLQHPARLVPFAFMVVIAIGTTLLTLPEATPGPSSASLLTALFTATSATCVTGLVVVDTGTAWTGFGQTVILGLFQVGGFGIMTFATMLGLLVTRRLGLQSRLVAQAETRTLDLGDVRHVLLRIGALVLSVELVAATILTLRMRATTYDDFGEALWNGVFHAISAFNNAGFSLNETSLMEFVTDPWVCLPIAFSVIIGGIGFPVFFELTRRIHRPRTWSIHTQITLWGTLTLLVIGTVGVLTLEWSNPGTLGGLDTGGKLLAGFFQSVMPRTAGFNSLDYSEMHTQTWALTDILMFIGGGSAGTAGGVKVTTFFLLAFVIWAEVRGESDVNVARRRISPAVHRQALTVALLGVALVASGTFLLLLTTHFSLDQVLFEAISAFATVGLSTGITGDLHGFGQVVLIVLMFVGRVGTITVATALALRSRRRHYRLPEERPIVG